MRGKHKLLYDSEVTENTLIHYLLYTGKIDVFDSHYQNDVVFPKKHKMID